MNSLFYTKFNNRGFASMVEVMISAVIFLLATVGIMTTVSSLKPQQEVSKKRLEVAYFMKQQFENLRAINDPASWDANKFPPELSLGASHPISGAPAYVTRAEYTVSTVPGTNDIRQITMTIEWTE